MKQDLWIFGAGAIGRGYLPWVFEENQYNYHFVDVNNQIINRMKDKGSYSSYRVEHGKLLQRSINCASAQTLEEFSSVKNLGKVGAAFVSVGPRNCVALSDALSRFSAPVILCENDPKTVDLLKMKTGRENFFFAVPDVITSNTAPQTILNDDSLAVITESGTLFIDGAIGELAGEYVAADKQELSQQWIAKLYLHNTPHCIAAYLGALVGRTYLHESMAKPALEKIVKGAMEEMLVALKRRWDMPHEFLDWYAEKELDRFRDQLLHDPISRVAREPLRKLDLDGRLIGAAQICLEVGVTPLNIIKGIAAALLYEDEHDRDKHIQMMRRAIPSSVLFSTVLGLRSGEALEHLLMQNFDRMAAELHDLKKAEGGSV